MFGLKTSKIPTENIRDNLIQKSGGRRHPTSARAVTRVSVEQGRVGGGSALAGGGRVVAHPPANPAGGNPRRSLLTLGFCLVGPFLGDNVGSPPLVEISGDFILFLDRDIMH